MEERLTRLRGAMKEKNIQAWIIPTQDPHNSEYVAAHFAAREWFSGFTGSAGTLVVTQTQSGLWTDTRYSLQARSELEGSNISLFMEGMADTPAMADWLIANLSGGATVSFDARCMTLQTFNELEPKLLARDLRLVPGPDLPGQVWDQRPALPSNPVRAWTGPGEQGSRKARMDRLVRHLASRERDWMVISALDQIAWFLGLRGSDIPFNPLFLAYILIGSRGMVLFVEKEKLDVPLMLSLQEDGFTFADYHALGAYLQTLAAEDRIMIPPESSSLFVFQNASHMRVIQEESPIDAWKAVISDVQLEALRETCTLDGAALVRSLHELPAQAGGNEKSAVVDEHGLGLAIAKERAANPGYFGESFPPIIGFGPHGAIVHYRAPEVGSARIEGRGLLLVDCGGHYTGGTTDITRVFPIGGEASPEERRIYTLVLKGHMRLARTSFPAGTRGQQLDVLARQDLWANGYNYGHGTGHGVGYGMCVHEGPQRISPLGSRQVLLPGMILSNEPGCYLEGSFGVRIENIMAVVPDPGREGFLRFETLSLFPLEQGLMDLSLLDAEERKWIDAYHHQVWVQVSRHLDRDHKAWLKEKTKALSV